MALYGCFIVAVVQSSSRVQLFSTPWTTACQASLSLTISRSLLKFMSIALVMPSSHLIFWRPLLLLPSIFPSVRDFSSQSAVCIRWPQMFASGGQSIGASASASVLPMNIQGWYPLRWIGLISLPSKELSGVFSSSTVQKCQFFSAQPSLWSNSCIHTGLLENHSFDYMDLCHQNDVLAF